MIMASPVNDASPVNAVSPVNAAIPVGGPVRWACWMRPANVGNGVDQGERIGVDEMLGCGGLSRSLRR